MALELLSKKVSCKYKHNSLKETLSCLLTLFHLQPPLIKHTPNTHIPCHPHQMRTWVFSCSEWERPLHQRAFQQRPPERRKEAFFFFFCSQERAFPKIRNVETGFLYQRLNFRGCPHNAPPHFTSAPFCQKKKDQNNMSPPTPRNTFKSACQRKERKEDGENKNNDDNAPRPLRF